MILFISALSHRRRLSQTIVPPRTDPNVVPDSVSNQTVKSPLLFAQPVKTISVLNRQCITKLGAPMPPMTELLNTNNDDAVYDVHNAVVCIQKAIAGDDVHAKAITMYNKVDAFHFNTVKFASFFVNGGHLTWMMLQQCIELDICSDICGDTITARNCGGMGVDLYKLVSFVHAIEGSYHAENAFHNATHATDVLVFGCSLLQFSVSGTVIASSMSPLEKLMFIVACCCHDVEHPGVRCVIS